MATISDFFSLGSIVWCRTCYNTEVEGEVLAFDPQTKILILKCHSSNADPKLNDVHFVNLSLVSELQVKKEVTTVPEVPQSLNLQRLNTRVRNQVDEKKRMLQAISANVSSEGQSLFIAIAKTINEVRWRNSEIVVWNQEVIITPPYQLENIRGNPSSKEYGYIRKVVKRNIKKLRENVTDQIWRMVNTEGYVYNETNFTVDAKVFLKNFEGALLKAMTKDGWNGEEDENKVEWTSTGALFYSIIVITTIGYGHIAPKTTWGKVVTIFYAILGIPLMLVCLSNIGDVMATSFRFLYWRVCCYVCRKKPKKGKRKSVRGRTDGPPSRFSRSRNTSFRRSMRTSTRSADSGFAFSENGPPISRSDTDLRYLDEVRDNRRGSSLPRLKAPPQRLPENPSPSRKITTNQSPYSKQQMISSRGGSLDRRKAQTQKDVEIELDPIALAKTPILCNKYVVGNNELLTHNIPGITTREMEHNKMAVEDRRAISMPRTSRYLEPPRFPSPSSSDREDGDSVRSSRPHRKRSPAQNPSPRMMTPLGYAHRSKYLDDPDSDEDYYEDSVYDAGRTRIKPVPIWLCVFLVVSYIIAGAFLFDAWENWGFLDSAYFCFITLTTIGFGDLVPAKGVAKDRDGYYATVSIALCSLYLLFGISLLAMSFNLVQEQVINNVKKVAKTLGIIKSETDESEDEFL